MFHVKHLFSSTRLFHVKHLSASGCLEARRGRSRIASPARAPPVLRIRGAVGARARFYTGASATRRPAASTRVRERRDALRLRCGRERGATSCGFGAGAPLCAGQLRGKRATCAGRSCERDALRCGCAEPAFTPPGTPGARASDGPLRRSPARRVRTACRRRAPCCPR